MNGKEKFIDFLYSRGEYIRRVNETQYVTRCPFCGDSDNKRHGHLYIHIDINDNDPIVYHCFKCESSGIVNNEFFTIIGLDNNDIKASFSKYKSKSNKFKKLYESSVIYFDYKIPEITDKSKIKYIEDRLSCKISDDDIRKTKIITSLKSFLNFNNIKEVTLPINYLRNIEDHYIGFLSFGNSHILFRDMSGKEKYKWIKYPITKESKMNKIFYSIENSIDIFSNEPIIINLAEGVLDTLSIYKNLGYNDSNSINISVCGKRYVGVLETLVDMGIIGDNVTVNIFADNDEVYNKKNTAPTTPKYFGYVLRRIKYLYKEVNIYYNLLDKDVGVSRNNIKLKKFKI